MPESPGEQQDLQTTTDLIQMEQDGDRTELRIGPYSAFLLVSTLQLALRHPDFGENIRESVYQLAREIQSMFAGGPVYEQLERGWNPDLDREQEPQSSGPRSPTG